MKFSRKELPVREMVAIIHAIAGLVPDAQLILAMSVFTLVVVIAVSPSAKSNICDFVDTLARFFNRGRKALEEPQKQAQEEPPNQDAA